MHVSLAIFSSRISRYPQSVFELENNFADVSGAKFNISCNNGTMAFEACCFALGLKPGDEILLSEMSFYSVVTNLLFNGLSPRYLEFDQNLQPVLDDSAVTPKSKAILVSHLFGMPNDLERIQEFARRHSLFVIQDASHAHGALFSGSKLSAFGDVIFYSLQGDKAVSGGEAGISSTNEEIIADRMRLYLQNGPSKRRCAYTERQAF